MLIVKNGARERVVIDLGRGGKAHACRLDAFAVKAIAAETRAELTALRTGEQAKRRWSTIPPERIEAAKVDDDAANALFGWMHAVLTATASVEQLDGIETGDLQVLNLNGEIIHKVINKRPLEASFEAFELIFLDAQAETLFRMQAPALELIWTKEKNVSASGPNGSGSEASNSAPDAGKPVTPAPEEASERTSQTVAPEAPAPSAQTLPEQQRENSPGNLAPPPPGDSSAAD